MQTSLYIGLAFIMGIIMSIYLPMNSSVSRHLGSSITANVTFFLVALATSLVLFIGFGKIETIYRLKTVPMWLYLTGFISAFIVLGTTFLIPHIGARRFFLLVIAGQVLMAVAVSHFGLLESPKDPINLTKVIGATFVVGGAILSTR